MRILTYPDWKVVSEIGPHGPVSDPGRPPATWTDSLIFVEVWSAYALKQNIFYNNLIAPHTTLNTPSHFRKHNHILPCVWKKIVEVIQIYFVFKLTVMNELLSICFLKREQMDRRLPMWRFKPKNHSIIKGFGQKAAWTVMSYVHCHMREAWAARSDGRPTTTCPCQWG